MLKYVTVTERKRKKSSEESNEDDSPCKSSEKKNRSEKKEQAKEEVNKDKVSLDSGVDAEESDDHETSQAVAKAEQGKGKLKTSKLQDVLRYEMVKGDLFSCSEVCSLAHCVSADMRLGKGIATLFKKKFGGIDDLKKQGASTGGLALLVRGRRFIYNLVTKDKYFQKPTYKSLESSLLCMKKHCQDNDVTKLAMPMIGCGLDGLVWTEVEKLIRRTFADVDMSITVYRL